MKKLTILITNYNKEMHISYNIMLLKQKLQNNSNYENDVEVQIYDDGSTDTSVEVIKQVLADYDGSSIKTYFLDKNNGIGYVREMALQNVNSDYFIFVDSDDLVDENYISSILNYINEDPISDIHHFGVRIYPDGGTCCIGFALWDKVMKTSFIRSNNIHFDETLRGHEDEAFMDLVWACNPKINEKIRDVLYIYNTMAYNTITHQEPMWYNSYEVRKEFE